MFVVLLMGKGYLNCIVKCFFGGSFGGKCEKIG